MDLINTQVFNINPENMQNCRKNKFSIFTKIVIYELLEYTVDNSNTSL